VTLEKVAACLPVFGETGGCRHSAPRRVAVAAEGRLAGTRTRQAVVATLLIGWNDPLCRCYPARRTAACTTRARAEIKVSGRVPVRLDCDECLNGRSLGHIIESHVENENAD